MSFSECAMNWHDRASWFVPQKRETVHSLRPLDVDKQEAEDERE
jgi:hypothetical protein